MKPAPFDYYAPTSLDDALANIATHGHDGKILAGGQSLIPAMNFRMARPAVLIDLNKVKELAYIRLANNGGMTIGAMTRDSTVEDSIIIKERFSLAIETIKHIAHRQIRNQGTFGGAMAHADPAAQLPALAISLKAKFLVRSQKGDRWVEAVDFFTGPFMTVLEPDEILTEIYLPPMEPWSAGSYMQVSRQNGGYAQAAAISVVALDDGKYCKEVRVVLFSVGATPILSASASKALEGQRPTAELIRSVAEAVAREEVDPGTDIHGTADYRSHLVKELVQSSLTEAFKRVKK